MLLAKAAPEHPQAACLPRRAHLSKQAWTREVEALGMQLHDAVAPRELGRFFFSTLGVLGGSLGAQLSAKFSFRKATQKLLSQLKIIRRPRIYLLGGSR